MDSKEKIIQFQIVDSEEIKQALVQSIQAELQMLKSSLGTSERDRFLTRKEAAEMLDISYTCLNDWCKKGILIPLKMGNRTYFKLSDIESKLNSSNNID